MKKASHIKKRPSMNSIANEIGVSVATVWRVLNNRSDVKPETRDLVTAYLKKNGYDSQPKSNAPKIIGIVDTFKRHGLSSYYLSSILEGADQHIHAHGFTTALIHAATIERDIREYEYSATLQNLAGVLWMEPVYNSYFDSIIKSHDIPCVVINNCSQDVDVDIIESDNYTAAKIATEFLIGNGHTAIGFIGGWLNLTNHSDRFRGYLDAMSAGGIDPNQSWIVNDLTLWNDEGGREGIHRILSSISKPSAVLVCSDFLINGAYSAIKEMGFSIPEDISVISFDDFPMAVYMDPPLTSCRQPLRDIGTMAAERLIHTIHQPEGKQERERTFLRMPFIVRNSTSSRMENSNSIIIK